MHIKHLKGYGRVVPDRCVVPNAEPEQDGYSAFPAACPAYLECWAESILAIDPKPDRFLDPTEHSSAREGEGSRENGRDRR